ncbi:MAG TPA: response regulator transcription factor [Mycobacteriales bacterium]
MISALVCDDHRLFGESFAAALEGRGAQATVTADPDETVAALREIPADRVVLNVAFPGGRGLAVARHIRTAWPQIHVSCLGADAPAMYRAAVDAGAQAILSKKRPLGELVETVLDGSTSLHGRGAGSRPRAVTVAATRRPPHQVLAAQFLTNREREVLRRLVSAQSTYRIADELGISVTTTRGYVQSILAKFGVHSRVEAVAYAVRHSVVTVSGRS